MRQRIELFWQNTGQSLSKFGLMRAMMVLALVLLIAVVYYRGPEFYERYAPGVLEMFGMTQAQGQTVVPIPKQVADLRQQVADLQKNDQTKQKEIDTLKQDVANLKQQVATPTVAKGKKSKKEVQQIALQPKRDQLIAGIVKPGQGVIHALKADQRRTFPKGKESFNEYRKFIDSRVNSIAKAAGFIKTDGNQQIWITEANVVSYIVEKGQDNNWYVNSYKLDNNGIFQQIGSNLINYDNNQFKGDTGNLQPFEKIHAIA